MFYGCLKKVLVSVIVLFGACCLSAHAVTHKPVGEVRAGADAWAEFERTLENSGEISFWWRDDDVLPVMNRKYSSRLKKMLKLLEKEHIPAVFGVIPEQHEKKPAATFRENNKYVKLLRKYDTYVVLHGVTHINNAAEGRMSEFPDGCDAAAAANAILRYKNQYESLFGDRFLPVFAPPFNYICAPLEQKLLNSGFTAISLDNPNAVNKSVYNIDIDIINWAYGGKIYEEDVLRQITDCIKRGQKVVGLLNHYGNSCDRRGYKFFKKFFKTVSKHENVKWVVPGVARP